MRNIVILTGAGISAESGIDTFRDAGGLWEKHKVEDVATPEAFERDPDLVLRFYDMRREAIQAKQPNAAHEALAKLDAAWDGELLIVTQNVDDVHERGAASRVLHMHGTHLNAWCTACDMRTKWTGPMLDRPACPECGEKDSLVPCGPGVERVAGRPTIGISTLGCPVRDANSTRSNNDRWSRPRPSDQG